MGDDKWLRYAKKLNFTDAQYEEAIKMIEKPENTNQFLLALLDLKQRSNQAPANRMIINESAIILDRTFHQATETSTTQQDDESTSSCYSSITSGPSSSSQSLEFLQTSQQSLEGLRRICIDGPNVARSHGKDVVFSWIGIKICVEWFTMRQHRVKVFVPAYRCSPTNPIIDYLIDIDALIKTPDGCNDDLFVIEAAKQTNAVIVSNDLFRDEAKFNTDIQSFIHFNRLPYIFVDDLFIPANDPLGRAGPTLEKFLRDGAIVGQQAANFHNKLSRTKSHQRYTDRRQSESSKQALCRTKSHNI